MNYLIGLGYPHYKGFFEGDGRRASNTYIYLTIVIYLIIQLLCYFDNITCTIEENATWENR